MINESLDFLLNGNGDKFKKKSQYIKLSDRIFNWVETVKKPAMQELKIEYQGQKYNSYASKESRKNFRQWKRGIFKNKKLEIKKKLKNELINMKKNNGNVTLDENFSKLIFPKRKISDLLTNYKSFNKEFEDLKMSKYNIKKFLIWNNVQHGINVIKKIGMKTDEELESFLYEDIYKYKINRCYATVGLKTFEIYSKKNIKYKKEINNIYNDFKNSESFDKSNIRNKNKYIKERRKQKINFLKNRRSIEKMSKAAFNNEKKSINRDSKFEKQLIKQDKPLRKMFSLRLENFFLRKREISSSFKLLKTELLDIHKITPIEISKRKFLFLTIIGSILPGTSDLIEKRWFAGLLKILTTILLISLVLPWIFGAFPSQSSNGIIGLSNFGATNGHLLNGNDSRYYLVTGSLAVLMLFISISYFIIAGSINVNNMKKIKLGLRKPKFSKAISSKNLPYLLTAPALMFIVFIVILPLLASLFISFTNYNQRVSLPGGTFRFTNGATIPFEWVGFDQFKYIVKIVGKDFSKVFLWTLLWTFGATLLTLFIGTLFAILVNQKRIIGKGLIRVIYILPWAIPGFVSLLFFSIIFNEFGIFNDSIGKSLFGRNIDWKNEVNYEKSLLIFIQMWLGQSYIFILITGMIQSIPKDLYESSKIDGASNLNNFRKITLPIIVKAILPLLIGQFVGNFNNFNTIYLFNQGGPTLLGNSVGETDIFISWIYDLINGGGALQRPAAGAALSFIVAIFVVTPSAFIYFRSKSFRERS